MFPVPSPDPSSPYLTVPLASLLPFGANREPGLILVSSSGEVRFWDSIGTGLAGAERFSSARITLAENETVTGLERVDACITLITSLCFC
jgi:nuclear pore complex protein Nup133